MKSFQDIYTEIIRIELDYGKEYNIKIDQEFAFSKLIEEVGEFAQAKLTYEQKSRPEKWLDTTDAKQKVAEELADIVGMAFVNAYTLNIDIEKALKTKWLDRR
ncbi:phosphoribosyl-ATP pyrophosphohydrolase [Candidatus Gracilibacteria bacterium]|nr:MAG: phosphoribosyl-ATP pyrophosphohydrolase [Candidatus Gracilibacteria bacterium]